MKTRYTRGRDSRGAVSRLVSKDRLGFSRLRRLLFEPLEERALLALTPLGVDLQAGSDSGVYDDDNLTNISPPLLITLDTSGPEGPIVPGSDSKGVTITVTSLADTFASDGLVTLREALQAANTDAPFNEAPAGNGADTIVFDSGLLAAGAQTLTLSGVELSITSTARLLLLGRFGRLAHTAGNGGHGRKG